MARHLVTQQQAATHYQVTDKTIRNWVSKGLITGYRLPGARAIRVDLNEIEAMTKVIPTYVARPGHRPFGDRAKIVNVIEAYVPGKDESGGR